MSVPAEAERVARAALTWVAEPGDPAMGALLRICCPAEILAALTEGRMPRITTEPAGSGVLWEGGAGPGGIPRLESALPRWSARLGEVPPEPELAAWWRDGIRLVIPGDAEWPSQLDVLGQARPWGLWVRGHADLRYACLRSVSVVGTRAATGYGSYVCGEMAVSLADAGWTIVSGGAFGIDGCAHRGAIAVAGVTVAVLPCGVDLAYPQAHEGLFRSIREQGALVSEWPPGRMPTRHGHVNRTKDGNFGVSGRLCRDRSVGLMQLEPRRAAWACRAILTVTCCRLSCRRGGASPRAMSSCRGGWKTTTAGLSGRSATTCGIWWRGATRPGRCAATRMRCTVGGGS